MEEIKKLITELINRSGFQFNSLVNDSGVKEMCECAVTLDMENPQHRKILIRCLTKNFDKLYLSNWKQYIPNSKFLDSQAYKVLDAMIKSVDISYNDGLEEFIVKIDDDYFSLTDGFNYNDSVYEFLSPSWPLRSVFMNKSLKEQNGKQLIIDLVKNIVVRSNLYNDLFNELPEILNSSETII